MSNPRCEIRLSGSGGQGIILAGIILAEAAVLDGRNVVQTQSYGPEARGGASKAEVIISAGEIDYPKVAEPDVLLAMTQEAYNRHGDSLRKGYPLIIDSTLVQEVGQVTGPVYAIPITTLAREKLGKEMSANMVALGVLVGLTQAVTWENLLKAALSRVPKDTADLNQKALELGREAAQARLKQQGINGLACGKESLGLVSP